ncbi:MAG: nuclear transport factor 2 family protein [Gemmatimonadota bacterium]|nr:nuclear transport factor 2 family protein [Gemmatimonadota bacterium]
MRLHLTAVLVATLLVPTTASTQSWSPAEREIIDLNQGCWDAWASHELPRIAATCNEHPDARSWWTPNAAPDKGWYATNVRRFMDAVGSKEVWIYWEINPISVRIFNGTALIHFWATQTVRGIDGEVKTTSQKQLNIWQRIDGRWTFIGGMAVPDPDSGR